jgi:hypothetical protein
MNTYVYLFIIIIILLWRRGGKCVMHRNALGVVCGTPLQHGLPLGLFARWTVCRLAYPLKPTPR